MALFSKKRDKLYRMVERYFLKIEEFIGNFKKTMDVYFERGLSREFDQCIEKTHISESCADDIRREIEFKLYEKSLIPESRGDILGLLENADRIPDKAQSVLYQIQTQFLKIPGALKEDFIKLIDINLDAFKDVLKTIRGLFENIKEVREIVGEIDKKESLSDRLEREIIRRIFSSEVGTAERILLKELVIEIGNISDLSQNVGDRINIIAIKKLV